MVLAAASRRRAVIRRRARAWLTSTLLRHVVTHAATRPAIRTAGLIGSYGKACDLERDHGHLLVHRLHPRAGP